MKDNINEIDTFIKKLIIEKQNLKIHTIENEIERPELKKDFSILDYIQSNYN